LTNSSSLLRFVRVASFAVALYAWWWLLERDFTLAQGLLVSVGGVLAGFPVTWIGRQTLDAQPTPARAEWVTTAVHFALMVPLGAAIIAAVRVGQVWHIGLIAVPSEVGLTLMTVTGVGVLLAMLNLALQGLGAPFAIALSRRLAVKWLYAWTRNPMVLSALGFLIAVGLWLRSGPFLVWVLLLATPTILVFVKVYEERELEIRFGASYLDYKARTPMLWPRKPRD
jgi:protein-S-isoprenylcysteine O-methyltransferase Ste14